MISDFSTTTPDFSTTTQGISTTTEIRIMSMGFSSNAKYEIQCTNNSFQHYVYVCL